MTPQDLIQYETTRTLEFAAKLSKLPADLDVSQYSSINTIDVNGIHSLNHAKEIVRKLRQIFKEPSKLDSYFLSTCYDWDGKIGPENKEYPVLNTAYKIDGTRYTFAIRDPEETLSIIAPNCQIIEETEPERVRPAHKVKKVSCPLQTA